MSIERRVAAIIQVVLVLLLQGLMFFWYYLILKKLVRLIKSLNAPKDELETIPMVNVKKEGTFDY